jgi:hypothetical protein
MPNTSETEANEPIDFACRRYLRDLPAAGFDEDLYKSHVELIRRMTPDYLFEVITFAYEDDDAAMAELAQNFNDWVQDEEKEQADA